MGIPPPTPSYPARQQGTSTTAAQFPLAPRPVDLLATNMEENLAHPQGYQQDAHAADFRDRQTGRLDGYTTSAAQRGSAAENGGEEGVWNTAKRWATAAGESLAAAESDVWKRINKE